NGELEEAWHDWAAAVARIDAAAAWPNTNLMLGGNYLFSESGMKSWDRTTLTAGFDGMENLAWPSKTAQAARVALDGAREAAEAFRAEKFALQRRVLGEWLEYALLVERLRLRETELAIATLLDASAAGRVAAGARAQDALQARIEARMVQDELASLRSEVSRAVARLNATVGRPPDAPLPPPPLPEARPLLASDAELLALGVAANPELAALAQRVQGRDDALELARRQYLPDINPVAMLQGNVEWAAGAMVVLPTTRVELSSMVQQAQAELEGARALLRQGRLDRTAAFVATLAALRDAERQRALFEGDVLPLAEGLSADLGAAYATGGAELMEMLDAERLVVQVREVIAEARIAREDSLAALEELLGLDAETLGPEAEAEAAAGAEAATTAADTARTARSGGDEP
ncbi:MAG TPA: TolC family protein, partial [Planctomycetota bacterium]|nr:TolC family protein [Planctomycetota bacterium]